MSKITSYEVAKEIILRDVQSWIENREMVAKSDGLNNLLNKDRIDNQAMSLITDHMDISLNVEELPEESLYELNSIINSDSVSENSVVYDMIEKWVADTYKMVLEHQLVDAEGLIHELNYILGTLPEDDEED